MTSRLEGKTALITGGSAGIGYGIAKAYLEEGANVMITSRNAERCEQAAESLAGLGSGQVAWRVSHAEDPEQGRQVMTETLAHFGTLDILVNNAAANPWVGRTIDVDPALLDKTYEVNLRGPLLWTQEAWNLCMRERGGCVINIASVGGFLTHRDLGVYAMFKSTLIQLTKQLAAELGPQVRVNGIAPAVVKTELARPMWDSEWGKQFEASYPLKRFGELDDIGKAAAYLAIDADWMTGHTMVIDGGELVRVDPPDDA